MTNEEYFALTRNFVSDTMIKADPGHDLSHIDRVFRMSVRLAELERAEVRIAGLAALLHDIADTKFHDGDPDTGPRMAGAFLHPIALAESERTEIVHIIRHLSFKSSFESNFVKSIEFQVVQDADRLDAIGAIGIARAFSYGGFKGRPMYDPAISPELFTHSDAYQKSKAPTINHFYEKLLLLKDLMNTVSAKKLAEERHAFMLRYLDQFYSEWNQ